MAEIENYPIPQRDTFSLFLISKHSLPCPKINSYQGLNKNIADLGHSLSP